MIDDPHTGSEPGAWQRALRYSQHIIQSEHEPRRRKAGDEHKARTGHISSFPTGGDLSTLPSLVRGGAASPASQAASGIFTNS